MKRPEFLRLGFWRGAAGGRAAEDSRLALPSPAQAAAQSDALRQKLIHDFQKARYGVTFRTQSFPSVIEGEREYYRALATSVDMGQWDIHRVIERDVQMESSVYPVATDNLAVRVVKSGLGFFDALEHLARYETTRTNEPLAPDKATLGKEHYVKFAMLHDIVFDLHGMPQPTIAGHVAVSGDYPVTALQALQITRQDTAGRDVMARQALMDAHRQASDIAKNFKVVLRDSERSDDHSKMNGMIEMWLALMADCWPSDDFCVPYAKGIDSHRALGGHLIRETALSPFRWDWGMKDRVYELYQVTTAEIEKLNNIAPAERKMALALLKECASVFLIQDAKYLAKKLDQSIATTPDPKTLQLIETLSDQNTQVVFGPITKSISFGVHRGGFLARAMTEPLLTEVPPHFHEVLAQLKGKQGELSQSTTEAWRALRPPKP
jgi:hypothetical protein